MTSLDKIADMLDGKNKEILRSKALTEVRLRVNRPVYADMLDGSEAQGERIDVHLLRSIVNLLMDNSLYSRENELKQGYFTTRDGYRVGVCGKINSDGHGIKRLINISSACIRIPREIKGAADEIVRLSIEKKRYSTLIISPPGLGKTTLLRDYIRNLSERGMNIGLADERGEIAGCLEGVPQLDVGCRTDVLDGCPKHLALNMMIRSCAPDLVAADEIGNAEDAQAIMDARRCGVAVAASVHGWDLEDILRREHIRPLMKENVFDWCVILGPERGLVQRIIALHEGAGEGVNDGKGYTSCADTACLHLRGTHALQCAQAKV